MCHYWGSKQKKGKKKKSGWRAPVCASCSGFTTSAWCRGEDGTSDHMPRLIAEVQPVMQSTNWHSLSSTFVSQRTGIIKTFFSRVLSHFNTEILHCKIASSAWPFTENPGKGRALLQHNDMPSRNHMKSNPYEPQISALSKHYGVPWQTDRHVPQMI